MLQPPILIVSIIKLIFWFLPSDSNTYFSIGLEHGKWRKRCYILLFKNCSTLWNWPTIIYTVISFWITYCHKSGWPRNQFWDLPAWLLLGSSLRRTPVGEWRKQNWAKKRVEFYATANPKGGAVMAHRSCPQLRQEVAGNLYPNIEQLLAQRMGCLQGWSVSLEVAVLFGQRQFQGRDSTMIQMQATFQAARVVSVSFLKRKIWVAHIASTLCVYTAFKTGTLGSSK